MRKVCSWCAKETGTAPSNIHSDNIITHCICKECLNNVVESLAERAKLIDFLNRLDAPVVMVNTLGCVSSANNNALTIIQKELQDVEGFSGGDVFECAYAKLPEGCGKTIHCNGCTIRNTVMDTLLTGQSHLETPAYLNRGNPEDTCEIQFLISTEKVNEVVLLRIDKVGSY